MSDDDSVRAKPGAGMFRRSAERIRKEVDEELRFDLEMRAAELVRGGASQVEARQIALTEFGDIEYTRRYCAEMDEAMERTHRRAEWLAELRQDVRMTCRALIREPAFALVVLVTLALGIGANTAVYSVLQKVLIAGLPYEDPARLLRLYGGAGKGAMLSAAEIAGLQESDAFRAVAPFGNYGGLTFIGDQRTEMWSGVQVGPAFFEVLGILPLLGRTIDERDVGPEAIPVVVLSHTLWQRSFGGDSSVVGTDVRLNDRTRTVVGVMPPDFVSPDRNPEVWTPLDLATRLRGPIAARGRMFRAIGRLDEGVTPAGLEAALGLATQRLRAADPGDDRIAPATPVALRDDMVGSVRPVLLVVMGAAALVLLLCCINVADLLLSRATVRRRELAIRSALGAGRARLVRQLLTESAVLALLGGAMGVALAYWSKQLFVDVLALILPSVQDVPMDIGVLGFALAVSLVSAVLFGLVPAVAGTRANPRTALAESSRGASAGQSTAFMSQTLVSVQIALAVVLLIGAGLLGRTLLTLERTGVGFDTGSDLLAFRVNLSSDDYADASRRGAFFDAYLERVRSLPGVRGAAAIAVAPWSGYTSFGPDSLFMEDLSEGGTTSKTASVVTVSEDWFETLDIPVLRGRTFNAADAPGSLVVAVVSESLARMHWADGSPLGRRIRVGRRDSRWLQVVGVVDDVRPGPSQDVPPTVYIAMRQHPPGGAEFVVRAAGSGLALVPAIERELQRIDPRLPAASPRALSDIFDGMLAPQRMPLLFTGAFAILALVLAVLGVYSVTAYSVAARRREFGIRVALGAQQGSVLGLVLRRGMVLTLIGIAAGVVIAALATSVLADLLVGVTPHDATTFVAVPVILLVVSCAACLIPARRAMTVEPLESLRAE